MRYDDGLAALADYEAGGLSRADFDAVIRETYKARRTERGTDRLTPRGIEDR